MAARILVIEDNPANLDLMTYLLTAFGHAALTAPDGEAGLARARSETPDLVVCDIQLSRTDGYAVARQMKRDAALQAIPLVAVTALAMVGDRDKVLAAGFDGYIPKPIDPETFVGRVEAFLPSPLRSTAPQGAASTATTAPVPEPRATILLVDDAPVNLNLECSLFEPVGYTVLTAGNMAQALATARLQRPDLIISDLNMAGGSGFDFIQAVKAIPELNAIPFVFVTSTYCDEASRKRGLALGAARFLFRPLEPQVLLAEIEACLRERT